MFDFIFDAENIETLYSICGVVGVSVLLFVGKLIAKRTSNPHDDEVIKQLQKSHQEYAKRKVQDNIKKHLDRQ